MLVDKLTPEEIELLQVNVDNIEDTDDYEEYNSKLDGTSYFFGYAGLQKRVFKGSKEEVKRISNFLPLPVKKIYIDNGRDKEGFLQLKGVLTNKKILPSIKVAYGDIDSAKWINNPKWDLKVRIISPKTHNRELLCDAMLNLAEDIPKETIFEHTGFRKIDGELVYLHQGGAIGTRKNISVDLSEISLERYKFTDKQYDLKECIELSLSVLDLANKAITIPLIALVYLSPLRSIFLEENIPLGFVTWLSGESGSQKSSLSALILSHFGDFERDNLPGGFKDTVNSIEKKAFTLQDILFAIDDYYPSKSQTEGKKMDAVAESLFGLYGDRQARSRMRQDGQTVKMGFSARGMCIVTGESFPSFAESRTARALIIEIARGDIDLQQLSKIQKEKDKLSFCMKGYIQYIIDNYDDIRKSCKSKFIEYRNKANQGLAHGRIPEIVASEYMGIELFYKYAKENGVITEYEMQQMKDKAWKILMEVAKKQSSRTEDNRTDNMFFEAVQELLASNKIYLKSYKNYMREPDESLSTFVGYYDESKERCYLIPNVIFNEVVKFYGVQGIKFPGNAASTWKYLKEAGRLFPGEKDRNTTRKTINGKLKTMIEVNAKDVFGELALQPGDYLSKFSVHPENRSKNISMYDDDYELPF